jgi:NAD(P)-dependent dehydrogenase (short-subunit alcohol dehydrogenase family)
MMIPCHLYGDKDALEALRRRVHLALRNPTQGHIMTLNGKRIVVLGGSSGIGLAVAHAAAREGASLVIVSSNRSRVDAALKSLPNDAEGHAADLSSEAAIQVLFATLGGFDHLAYTAGENLRLASLDVLDLEWARGFFDVRYWGALAAVKYGATQIRPGGSVTLTSGLAGRRPHAGWSVASSICGAIEGLTRALAVELAPIRVNIVSPGVVKSPLWGAMPQADREALYSDMAEKLLLRHVGEPEELAQSYLYLMKQTYGTGQVIGVDGGGALI